jgi:hypothetical protein
MAKVIASTHFEKPIIKRPGVHSKSKTSSIKGSKNYKKKYTGQGK